MSSHAREVLQELARSDNREIRELATKLLEKMKRYYCRVSAKIIVEPLSVAPLNERIDGDIIKVATDSALLDILVQFKLLVYAASEGDARERATEVVTEYRPASLSLDLGTPVRIDRAYVRSVEVVDISVQPVTVVKAEGAQYQTCTCPICGETIRIHYSEIDKCKHVVDYFFGYLSSQVVFEENP